jgi:predicted Zn finger-like uncharacterized protein
MDDATKFPCPHCDAQYKVVRIEVPPSHDDPVACLSCGGPLHAREGKFALKYFRVDGSQRRPVGGRKPIM